MADNSVQSSDLLYGPFKFLHIQFAKVECLISAEIKPEGENSLWNLLLARCWRTEMRLNKSRQIVLQERLWIRGEKQGTENKRWEEETGSRGDEEKWNRWGQWVLPAWQECICVHCWRIIWPQWQNTHLTSHSTGGSRRGNSNRQAGAYLNSEGEKIQDPIHTVSL